MNSSMNHAAELIANAKTLWIGAGAGMGVDSGLPDFRGDEGFWNAYPPYRELGRSFIDMANPSWFSSEPKFAWGFYGHRLNLYRETVPHGGFEILLNWCQSKLNGYRVFTSNVDGQFQKAGFAEAQIVECHGSIHFLQCRNQCHSAVWSADDFVPRINEQSMRAVGSLPICDVCKKVARPNILMFGDFHWLPDRSEIQERNYRLWLREISRSMELQSECVALEFGAGTTVPSVRFESASIPATLIRVNPGEHKVQKGLSFQMGALEFLQSVNGLIGST